MVLAASLAACGRAPEVVDPQPSAVGPGLNLVVLVVDTLRYDAVDLDRTGPTPALAGLAFDGVALERSFSHAPMTLPAHASLFSSRLPHDTGLVVNGQPVPDEVELLAEWVGRQGYRTLAAASMATLWERRVGDGLDQGFDDFRHVQRDYSHGLDTAAAVADLLDEHGYAARGGGGLPGGAERSAVVGEAGAAPAADSIETTDGAGELEPLLMFVHLADPHEPYRSFERERLSLDLSLDGDTIATADPRRAPHLRLTLALEAGEHELVYTDGDADFVLRSLYLHELHGQGAGLTSTPGTPAAGTSLARAGDVPPVAGLRTPDPGRRLHVTYHEGARLDSQRRVRVRFELEQPATVQLETWVTDHPSQAEAARRYHEEVRLADQAIGRVLDELRARGLYDSSLVLFTSDHGEAFGEHQHNGHSQNLFDELLHVPTILKLPAGARYDAARAQLAAERGQLVRHIDLAPTLLAALGLAPLPSAVGRSLLPGDGDALREPPGTGGGAPDGAAHSGGRVLFAETHRPEAARDQYALRDAALKLIYTPDDDRFRLFDVAADPRELDDVFAERGHERASWQARLRDVAAAWQAEPDGGPASPDLGALGY